MEDFLTFITNNKAVILAALLGISEVLALIPTIKSNGIFDALVRFLKSEQKGGV